MDTLCHIFFFVKRDFLKKGSTFEKKTDIHFFDPLFLLFYVVKVHLNMFIDNVWTIGER